MMKCVLQIIMITSWLMLMVVVLSSRSVYGQPPPQPDAQMHRMLEQQHETHELVEETPDY